MGKGTHCFLGSPSTHDEPTLSETRFCLWGPSCRLLPCVVPLEGVELTRSRQRTSLTLAML